ncbi:MAG: YggT family protein [Acidimicrobiia bacterium]|nr:YggT family protein [bacterium]MXX64871.1 YggT family protein [Acidimicrobiia bacterium]MCY3579019.1 YggT family protein [bacterium]MXZ06355.1 YggT family protein [Acidimicrobiia bacterium]MYD04581.1 YggT family protein [Acidimicrobiia bacterium]
MLRLVCTLLQLYVLAIVARAILSWLKVSRDHPVGRTVDFLAQIVDPLLRPIRRAIPAVPIGGIRLDLSPLVLIFGVTVVSQIICL